MGIAKIELSDGLPQNEMSAEQIMVSTTIFFSIARITKDEERTAYRNGIEVRPGTSADSFARSIRDSVAKPRRPARRAPTVVFVGNQNQEKWQISLNARTALI